MTINAPAQPLPSSATAGTVTALPTGVVTTDRAPEDPFEPLTVGAMVDRVAAMAVEKAAHPWAF